MGGTSSGDGALAWSRYFAQVSSATVSRSEAVCAPDTRAITWRI